MTDISLLKVALYGKEIGSLTHLPGDQILFSFTEAYINDLDRPTLSLSFKDKLGNLISDFKPQRTRLPPFFSNLLPEGPLREYLAKKGGVNPLQEFFLLQVLGRDLPGAVTVLSEDERFQPAQPKTSLANSENVPESALHFSLAGVQLKFSGIMEAAGGLTIPATGSGGSWIIKLPSMRFLGVPENEFAMMELARTVGIEVPEVRLVPVGNIDGLPRDSGHFSGNALAVKRFDRTESGNAIHFEDFAQIFGIYPEKKYGRASYRNLAEVIWAETGENGITEFIRRLVFNVLIGNADMHLKNWSLIYSQSDQRPKLSPGYDFVSTIAFIDDTNMALKLGRSKKMSELSLDQLAYLAAKAHLPEKLVLDTGRETVSRFLDTWQNGKGVANRYPAAIKPINTHLQRIPMVHSQRTAKV